MEGVASADASAEQWQAAKQAENGRLVDQLNGHVDFLNAQLAAREAQIRDMQTDRNHWSIPLSPFPLLVRMSLPLCLGNLPANN